VAEVAREVHAVRDRGAVRDAATRLRDVGGVRDREADAGEALAAAPFAALGVAFQLVEAVDGAAHRLDREPRRVVCRQAARALPREEAHGFADALVLERSDGRGEGPAQLLRVELGRFAAADEEPLLRGAAA